jgi:hypothetical protein
VLSFSIAGRLSMCSLILLPAWVQPNELVNAPLVTSVARGHHVSRVPAEQEACACSRIAAVLYAVYAIGREGMTRIS